MRTAFIHGFAGTPATWDGIAPADARCIWLPGHGPMRPGTGQEGGGACEEGWDANLAVIAAGIRGVKLVVGYSLGARVALGLVAQGHVERAVLVGVNPGLVEGERAERRAGDARWAAMLRRDGVGVFSEAWEAQALFATQVRAEPARRAARRAARRGLDAEGLARSLETMGLAEMPDYREVVDDRVRLIVGADDAKYLAIARGLPAPVMVIDGSGHDATLEQPARLRDALASIRW